MEPQDFRLEMTDLPNPVKLLQVRHLVLTVLGALTLAPPLAFTLLGSTLGLALVPAFDPLGLLPGLLPLSLLIVLLLFASSLTGGNARPPVFPASMAKQRSLGPSRRPQHAFLLLDLNAL